VEGKGSIFFNGGDMDLYGYCLGDPIDFVDSKGLAVLYWGFGVSTGLGIDSRPSDNIKLLGAALS
jgi:hypothetical protein